MAVIVTIAMLGGMGYATTSAALAEDMPATVENTTDQSATTANESTDGKNAADGTDADNAGDAATGTADTESDTNTGADADVNTANAANVGDAASSDANSQTDTTAQSNPQTVNAEQNNPSVVADATDSNCIYAGTNALQRVCWLDMSEFNSTTAKTSAGQKMTVNLGGGLTMSFIAHYSGKRTVVASGVPTWDNRTYQVKLDITQSSVLRDILISQSEASPRCIKGKEKDVRTIRRYGFQISPLLKTVRT